MTAVFWGSTSCPARLQAYDSDGKLVDKAALDAVPNRKAPGYSVPTFEMTVKGTNIAYCSNSAGRDLASISPPKELRFLPIAAPSSSRRPNR